MDFCRNFDPFKQIRKFWRCIVNVVWRKSITKRDPCLCIFALLSQTAWGRGRGGGGADQAEFSEIKCVARRNVTIALRALLNNMPSAAVILSLSIIQLGEIVLCKQDCLEIRGRRRRNDGIRYNNRDPRLRRRNYFPSSARRFNNDSTQRLQFNGWDSRNRVCRLDKYSRNRVNNDSIGEGGRTRREIPSFTRCCESFTLRQACIFARCVN